MASAGFDTVMAFDPGGTTGIAVRSNDTYLTCETEDPQELFDMIVSTRPDAVVFERFATSGRISQYGIYTVELCGAIHGIAYALNIPAFRHVPQDRYPFRKKATQFLEQTRGKHGARGWSTHEMDALAHLKAFEYVHDLTLVDIAAILVPGEYHLVTNGTTHYKRVATWRET